MPLWRVLILAQLLGASTSLAAGLASAGVLGNSGESGTSLVQGYESLRPRTSVGLGVVGDAEGTLWTRTAPGVLARLSLDGRQLASYRLPAALGRFDRLTRVGPLLVLLIDGKLYTLPTAAPPGSAAVRLESVTAQTMSYGTAGGRLALAAEDGTLALLDPASGATTPAGKIGVPRFASLEMTPDGAIHYMDKGVLHRLENGAEVTGDGWPRNITNQRENASSNLQYLDGLWFGHSGYGTIRRYDRDLKPAPGVAIGGSSGWFIGHVPGDSDLGSAQGMAQVGPDLYAACGPQGVLLLLRWRPAEGHLEIVRRLGAWAPPLGVVVDRQGRIFDGRGVWYWNDTPAAAYRFAVPTRAAGTLALLPGDLIAGPANRHTGMWFSGRLDGEPRFEEYTPALGTDEKGCACACRQRGNQLSALVFAPDGKGQEYRLGPDGRAGASLGERRLQPASPIKRWTSLAMTGDKTLLAAGDGWIVSCSETGDAWQEQRRWRSWGQAPTEAFGNSIALAADAGRLWVADTARHRVLCFDLASEKLLASFGTCDGPGPGLDRLNRPGGLAVSGQRAVVIDTGNCRLLRLAFSP